MTAQAPWAIAVCFGLLAAGCLIGSARRERKILGRLSAMLKEAAEGSYTESSYDETMLSEVESRMVRFLNASALSAKNLGMEQKRIQTLISDISHQTKTPIANLLLYTELLGEAGLPEESRTAVGELKKQSEKLRFLIDSLIKISRLENGIIFVTPEENSLEELMEGVLGQIRPGAEEKGIHIQAHPGGMKARFDRKWTEEALYNLADNAVKYTPKGGAVILRARAYELFVRIDVQDTGIGISEAEQGQIFSRFYRSGDVAKSDGIGVGLYLAREIVAKQGGYIRVESQKGKGALFSVYLPR